MSPPPSFSVLVFHSLFSTLSTCCTRDDKRAESRNCGGGQFTCFVLYSSLVLFRFTLNLYNLFDETELFYTDINEHKRAHPAWGQIWSSSSWSSCCSPLWVLALRRQKFCLLPSSNFSPGSSSALIFVFLLLPQLSSQQFHHC